jgi:hypothetical protein
MRQAYVPRANDESVGGWLSDGRSTGMIPDPKKVASTTDIGAENVSIEAKGFQHRSFARRSIAGLLTAPGKPGLKSWTGRRIQLKR